MIRVKNSYVEKIGNAYQIEMVLLQTKHFFNSLNISLKNSRCYNNKKQVDNNFSFLGTCLKFPMVSVNVIYLEEL